MTLCRYDGKGSLAKAHRLYDEARSKLKEGVDPATKKQTEKAEEREASTVEELINLYIEKHAMKNKRSWKEDKRILEKEIPSRWMKRKAKEITKREIISILDGIVDRGSPIAANRTFSCLRKMFKFARKRGVIDSSPCDDIGAPSKENRRDRVLSVNEIRILCNNLRGITIYPDNKLDIKMNHSTILAILLQLATMQRKGEVVSMRWDEIDFDTRWWTIPASKAKNGIAHRVYLSDHTFALLQEAKEDNQQTYKYKLDCLKKTKRRSSAEKMEVAERYKRANNWVFPSWTTGSHLDPSAPSKALRRSTFEKELDHHHCHDLRRTSASHMTAMGIARLVAQKILNHVDSSVTAVYDRHSYDAEKKRARIR